MKKIILSLILVIISLLGGYYAYQFFQVSPSTINSSVPVEDLSSTPAGNTNRSK